MVDCSYYSTATIPKTFIGSSVQSPEAVLVSKSLKTPATPCQDFIMESATPLSSPSTPYPVTTPLSDVVRTAFSQSNEIWFPEAAQRLSDFAWRNAARLAFTPENYGTHRWLQGDATLARLQLERLDFRNSLCCLIERLPQPSRMHYEKAGLEFSDQVQADLIQRSIDLISVVPSLYATISLYLRSLHILKAPGPDHDVSHSDPDVPFSIFVSVPPAGQNCRVRLAESIVHECMHLQLSIIERILRLVDEPQATYFSPWTLSRRPAAGVLHGLYVFSVIHRFLGCSSLDVGLSPEERRFTVSRRRQISKELDHVAPFAQTRCLSKDGRDLATRSLQCLQRCT